MDIIGIDMQPGTATRLYSRTRAHDTHQAMARTIFARPGVIVQFAELPGAQRLHRHEIGEQPQSTEPSGATNTTEWQSPMTPYESIG
jgi:hypothetical protein